MQTLRKQWTSEKRQQTIGVNVAAARDSPIAEMDGAVEMNSTSVEDFSNL